MADRKTELIRKAFVSYAKDRFPDEANDIIRRADGMYPLLHGKAPDIGGDENLMAYNLDMMILAASFYEASDRRIGGPQILEIAGRVFGKLSFLSKIVDVNRPWQMKLFRNAMYRRYVPYSELVEKKLAQGEWGNTWRVRVNPRNTDEGVCFDLVGCPLADFARENGYEQLLPYMCATDHLVAELMHAKLIRTHTCATGSSSCDYWYVGDRSDTAESFRDVEMK